VMRQCEQAEKSRRVEDLPAQAGSLRYRLRHGFPFFFCICGRERTCGSAKSYVWQGKGLGAYFLDVRQGEELRAFGGAERLKIPRLGGWRGGERRGFEE
jgi:hypothetical protein